MTDLADFVPALRSDFLRCEVDGETIVWSHMTAGPTLLDPVAALMLDVIDGEATVGQLSSEVSDEVGITLDVATEQIQRTVELFGGAGLLTASTSDTTANEAIAEQELFVNPCIPCMENSVRGMTSLSLRFGDRTVGVACDARRGVRKLRSALADHIVGDETEAPVGFVLTAPAGLQRTHHLADRSGFVHSQGRGLDAGLHALASHLTAFLPPEPGTVRVRAGAVVSGDQIVVCLFPLLLVPELAEGELAGAGFGLIDRLAIDIEVSSGRIVNPSIPWPTLADIGAGPGHLGPEVSGKVTTVVTASPAGSPALSRAASVVTLANGALHGDPREILDAVTRLIDCAHLASTQPEEGHLVKVLSGLRKAANQPL